MAGAAPAGGGSGGNDGGPLDAMSTEVLTRRHENRQVLIKHVRGLRGRIGELEREVAELERTIQVLPYDFHPSASSSGGAPPPPRRFSFLANAAAGGVALPLAIGAMHPLDTVRTRMQAALHKEPNFRQAFQSLGGWRGFARGIVPSIVWASPQGAIRLGCYESCKAAITDSPYGPGHGALAVSVSAVIGDLCSSFVKVPRELITQRMQTGQYTSGSEAFRSIVREDGVRGLLRGYTSTCFRDAPFMVLLFLSYEQFKTWKIRLTFAHQGPGQVLSPWSDTETVLWAGVSGAIAGLLTTPFDVIKTQVMTASGRTMRVGEALRAIGPYGLFTGAGPRSAWWFCVCSIFFTSFERLRIAAEGAGA
mmetsp:Transcript_4663/g.17569  ORF Transcript_4663/g.17569 Transcript_4663/m.17569 type:complete len:364 (-) Transcript_4663:36-1127(-)